MKICWFTTFHVELQLVQNLCELDSIKTDGFIRIYDGSKYLVLLGPEIYDAIYNRIRYHISIKHGITDVFSHYYAKIKVDFYDSLPIGKRLISKNVIIHIKSVFNKDQNHYYKIFLDKIFLFLAKK